MDDLISDEDELYCLIVERDKLSILKEEFSGILERFEELTDCRIVVEDQKELWGDEKPSQVLINIFGKGKDIAVVGQRLTTLVKDPTKLKRKQCSESVANLINSWSYLTLKEFQQKHTVLIDATQSPNLFLESWEDNLEVVHRNLEKHTLGPSSSSETAKTLNDINILLLGQSGSGKTMLINSLKFYLTHTSIEDAVSSELEPLIPTSFDIYTSEERKRIVKGASDEREPEKEKKMSDSDTQVTSSYVFSYRNGDETRNIRLIDTPGLADTKGLLQDEANLENILSFLTDYTDLHAIILVMPPNQSRCNVNFQFCIDSFLKQLHNSASTIIRVCLTNCRVTGLKPGNTVNTLQGHFQELQERHGIDLCSTLDDPFCFENDCCQYIWAKSLGHEFEAEETAEYEKNYFHSQAEAMRLLETILAMKPRKFGDSISINEAKKAISNLCKPLAAITKMINQNVLLIEEKQKENVLLIEEKQKELEQEENAA